MHKHRHGINIIEPMSHHNCLQCSRCSGKSEKKGALLFSDVEINTGTLLNLLQYLCSVVNNSHNLSSSIGKLIYGLLKDCPASSYCIQKATIMI